MFKFKQLPLTFVGLPLLVVLMTLATPLTSLGQKGSPPPPPTFDVNVVNKVKVEADQPLPVRDAADPARRPFVSGVNVLVEPGPSGSFANIPFNVTIPQGSRLVIERVSGVVRVSTGQVVTGSLNVTTNGQDLPHDLRFTFEGSMIGLLGGDRFVTADSLRLYADPGTDVILSIVRNASTGLGQGRMIISGYLVDVTPLSP